MSHSGKLQTPLKKLLEKHLSPRTEQNSLSFMALSNIPTKTRPFSVKPTIEAKIL